MKIEGKLRASSVHNLTT